MKCDYCGKEQEETKYCIFCGAKLPEKKDLGILKPDWKSEPFFYNGYIVYVLYHYAEDTRECQFWLGRELIEQIVVYDFVYKEHVQQEIDSMEFFWNLFLLAHDEKEVLYYQEKNTKYPATFEIRRVENPELGRLRGLSLRELATECRR